MRVPLCALLLLAPVLAAGCVGEEPTSDVLATFYPLAFLAERIGGANVTVGTVVPPGVEPHEWDPTARDLARFSGAKLVLAQGLGFEPWLDRIAPDTEARVVHTTEGIEAHEGEDEDHPGPDPHTWLDPVFFAEQARAVADALSATFPEHAPAFAARLETLEGDLAALHEEFEAGLAACERRLVIANHDAYGYLAERYDFTVHAIHGLSPHAEPDPRTLAELSELARENRVPVVFFEELTSDRVAQIIADEVGARTLVLSPIEGLTADQTAAGEDYMTLMRTNLAHLREAMGCA